MRNSRKTWCFACLLALLCDAPTCYHSDVRMLRNLSYAFPLLLAWLFLLDPPAEASVTVNVIPIPMVGGVSYNNFLYVTYVSDGPGSTNPVFGDVLSVTEDGTNLFFTNVVDSSLLQIYQFTNSPSSSAFSETFVVTWTNFSTNFTYNLIPAIRAQPVGGSFSAGSNLLLTAQVAHCNLYQWQKNGANLSDNGHVSGSLTAALAITNAQPADEGNYNLILGNANYALTNNFSTAVATFSVFKPVSASISSDSLGLHLLVANQDLSAVDSYESSNVVIYTSTNLDAPVPEWDVWPIAGYVTNGAFAIDFQNDATPTRFFRAIEPH